MPLTINTSENSLDCRWDNDESVEPEAITNDDPIDVWLDRLIELGVDVHLKQTTAEMYASAHKEKIKNLKLTEVYHAKNEFNQAKRVYVAFYADLYDRFLVGTLLSKSEITEEAETILTDYLKHNDPVCFQRYLKDTFELKFADAINGVVPSCSSRSVSITPDSSFKRLCISKHRNSMFENVAAEEEAEEWLLIENYEESERDDRKRYRPGTSFST